jgi:hypothetical protein
MYAYALSNPVTSDTNSKGQNFTTVKLTSTAQSQSLKHCRNIFRNRQFHSRFDLLERTPFAFINLVYRLRTLCSKSIYEVASLLPTFIVNIRLEFTN